MEMEIVKKIESQFARLGVDLDTIGPANCLVCRAVEISDGDYPSDHIMVWDDSTKIVGDGESILKLLSSLPDEAGYDSTWSALAEFDEI